jgi:hypothetical protein
MKKVSLSLHALIKYYLSLFVQAVSLLFGNALITIMFGSVSIGRFGAVPDLPTYAYRPKQNSILIIQK